MAFKISICLILGSLFVSYAQASHSLALRAKELVHTENPSVSTFEPGISTDQAQCRKNFPSTEEMRSELAQAMFLPPVGSSGIGGLNIINVNRKMIDAYRFLVSYKSFQFRPLQAIDFWSLLKGSGCADVLCASELIFGKEMGLIYLYVAYKYNLIMSPLGFDKLSPPRPEDQIEFDAYFKTRAWTKEEVGPYLRALVHLPQSNLKFYTRMNQAGVVNPMNKNILSNGIIQFYETMKGLSDSEKEQTTYHEIGHNYGSGTGLDSSKEWLLASNWVVDGKTFRNLHPESFVTRYSAKSFYEDFAESFVYYRYFPQILKTKSPQRYEFMKSNVFSGREYLNSQNCP